MTVSLLTCGFPPRKWWFSNIFKTICIHFIPLKNAARKEDDTDEAKKRKLRHLGGTLMFFVSMVLGLKPLRCFVEFGEVHIFWKRACKTRFLSKHVFLQAFWWLQVRRYSFFNKFGNQTWFKGRWFFFKFTISIFTGVFFGFLPTISDEDGGSFRDWILSVLRSDFQKDHGLGGIFDMYTQEYITYYCWWLKSCTTSDVKKPINNGINYQPQLVLSLGQSEYLLPSWSTSYSQFIHLNGTLKSSTNSACPQSKMM